MWISPLPWMSKYGQTGGSLYKYRKSKILIGQQKAALKKIPPNSWRPITKKIYVKKLFWHTDNSHWFFKGESFTENILWYWDNVHWSLSWTLNYLFGVVNSVMPPHWKVLQWEDKSSFTCPLPQIWTLKL
jgi:hypothetical protein